MERHLARQHGTVGELVDRLAQQAETPVEGLLEAGFLQPQGLGDQGLGAPQLGEGRAHFGDQGADQTT